MYRAFGNEIPGVPESHCLHNFRVAAKVEEGVFEGRVYQDSDLYKYLEAVGFYLARHEDPETEAHCNAIIDLIERAQLEDGYINTCFILGDLNKRWTRLAMDHELYCAGHLMEAACAYHIGTKRDKLLKIACRFADCIERTFGPEPGKLRGCPGHQEVEIGLLKLYEVTKEERYQRLAAHFLLTRGERPNYFDEERAAADQNEQSRAPHFSPLGEPYAYMQAHRPLLEQDKAVGHAVRANYMYTAAAHLAGLLEDEALLNWAAGIWENITQRQMYLTGGVGSMIYGEAYTTDYDLPNDAMYNETCASIALAMFSMRMLNNTKDARYADVIEQTLYNGILSGMQEDGTRFFYVNPMSVWKERCAARPDMEPVKTVRQGWFDTACCPPNILRTLTGLGQYIYSSDREMVLVNLFVESESEFVLDNGAVCISQTGGYPWDGKIRVTVHTASPISFSLGVRIPRWCRKANAVLGGEPLHVAAQSEKGYLTIRRTFHDGDVLELELKMPVECVRSNPHIPFNAGMVALRRGPVVYCMEETDNDAQLWNLSLNTAAPVEARYVPDLLGGVVALTAAGVEQIPMTEGALYGDSCPVKERAVPLRFVPYFAWCNREPGNMTVWVRERHISRE